MTTPNPATQAQPTPIPGCEFKNREDGCCSHPKNMTPECHINACPRITSLMESIELLSQTGRDGTFHSYEEYVPSKVAREIATQLRQKTEALAECVAALKDLKQGVIDVILPNARNISLDTGQIALWDACVRQVDEVLRKAETTT